MSYRIQSFDEYKTIYNKSVNDPEGFWDEVASSFHWRRKWDKVLSWNFTAPEIKWFEGGQLNITENCLDRHLETHGDKVALLWEANEPEEHYRRFTYKELHFKVMQFAQVLLNNGAKRGDRICIYMPMVPELAIAVLACARIGVKIGRAHV